MERNNYDTLKHLGKQDNTPAEKFDLIPWDGPPMTEVELHCSEFTSHCPVTKQPDFAQFIISYHPNGHLVETKSVKLYLWQFRDRAEFNEKLVRFIATDFFEQVRPRRVMVEGRFNQRGGIAVVCRCQLGPSMAVP